MPVIDERLDQYISNSAEFAKPILLRLRKLIHKACPDVTETIKWGFPHFMYRGNILCSMASFKKHCAFGFWLASHIEDSENILLSGDDKTAMGNLGQIISVKDIPSEKVIINYAKQAMKLIENGVKLTKKAPVSKKELEIPDYFTNKLNKNKKALNAFINFPYSHKKEYLEWIMDAKTEATRNKRMEQALEWLSEGKSRNWKYERS